MAVIRYSLPAFLRALLIVAAFHALLLVINFAAGEIRVTPSQAIMAVFRHVILAGTLLFVGHMLLRSCRVSHWQGYAATGAVLNVITLVVTITPIFMAGPPLAGSLAIHVVAQVLLGATAAAVYARVAGRQTIGVGADLQGPDGPFPVRVRTSKFAFVVMAMVPGGMVWLFTLPTSGLLSGDLPKTFPGWIIALAGPIYLGFLGLILTALPAATIIGITHVIARAMERMRGMEYATIGAGVAMIGACTLLTYGDPVVLLFLSATAGAIMGAGYRRIAGLEPVLLPEAVHVTDPHALVSADHAARRTRMVIRNG
jgi:hypothetical protein